MYEYCNFINGTLGYFGQGAIAFFLLLFGYRQIHCWTLFQRGLHSCRDYSERAERIWLWLSGVSRLNKSKSGEKVSRRINVILKSLFDGKFLYETFWGLFISCLFFSVVLIWAWSISLCVGFFPLFSVWVISFSIYIFVRGLYLHGLLSIEIGRTDKEIKMRQGFMKPLCLQSLRATIISTGLLAMGGFRFLSEGVIFEKELDSVMFSVTLIILLWTFNKNLDISRRIIENLKKKRREDD